MSTPSVPRDYTRLEPITPEIRRRVTRADKNDTIPSSVAVAEVAPGVAIIDVEPDSPAARAGLEVGDVLVHINGEPVRDTIDFFFHGAEERLALDIRDASGASRRVVVDKETPEQHLGIELQQFTTQQCGCNCVFCFVHQLPDNMRKSLYVKDEDYRLSFLQGSYVTGITLKDSDLERIARQRLTPLYISVHAIDEEVRRWLLGVKKTRPILEVLDFFHKNRIQVHTQIVLTPTHNDGERLDATLDRLLSYFPTVQSVAIVPLGMTKWREGLPDLPPVTREYARGFLRRLEPRLRAITTQFGEPIVMLADEWYLIAGRKAPTYSRWPDLPQLENGVGMVYHFYKDFADARRSLQKNPIGRPWRVGAVTSTLSAPVLEKLIAACREHGGIEVVPLPTVNHLLGETIHVTGLLSGTDIRRTIQANPGFDQYLLPGNCIRRGDTKFLDDMTLEQLRATTGARIDPVLGGAFDFAETILDAALGREHNPVREHAFLRPHWSNT